MAGVRLTNYDMSGNRWTQDRTIRITPQYRPGAHQDYRDKAIAYQVFDTLEQHHERVRNLRAAIAVAASILAARPRLDWSDWTIRTDGPSGAALTRVCQADGPLGPVEAWVGISHMPMAAYGMWAVGYRMGDRTAEWLTDIRHPPHRMAHVRAIAEHRTHKIGAPR